MAIRLSLLVLLVAGCTAEGVPILDRVDGEWGRTGATPVRYGCNGSKQLTFGLQSLPDTGWLPVEIDSHILLDVMLAGQGPLQFIVDTGAVLNAVTDQGLRSLEVPPGAWLTWEEHRVRGFGGSQPGRFVQFASMRVGPVTLTPGYPMYVLELDGPVEGLLGDPIWKGSTLLIDTANERIRFGADIAAIDALQPEWIDTVDGKPVFFGEVRGRRVRVQLDTGARSTSFTPSLEEALALERTGKTQTSKGVGPHALEVPLVRCPTLRVNTVELEPTLCNLNAPQTLQSPEVNLGLSGLGRHIVIVDGPRRRIGLAPSPTLP